MNESQPAVNPIIEGVIWKQLLKFFLLKKYQKMKQEKHFIKICRNKKFFK